MRRALIAMVATLLVFSALGAPVSVYAQRPFDSAQGKPIDSAQGKDASSPRARDVAPIDLTGYWVSYVTENWRYRMVTPAKGEYRRIPVSPAAVPIINAWDPAADTKAGNQCKSYGAGAIMNVPTRLHITWQDADTLRVETDTGTQTRLFRFSGRASGGKPTWQGDSTARWEQVAAPEKGGNLRVVTTNVRAGYLRKNGVPYSERATVTENFDIAPLPDGGELLLVTTVVEDPVYLNAPYVTSPHFKKEPDGSKWDPSPCSSTW